VVAVICMLALMGRAERKISATFLRRMHKGAGAVFLILLLVISYFCVRYWAVMGDQLSVRAVIHIVLSILLFIVLVLKISIVQFYKEFLRYVPVMGMIVFILAFTVFCTSAGYFFLTGGEVQVIIEELSEPAEIMLEGDAEQGAVLFDAKCSFCHHADTEATEIGPGLKNILSREALPFSGRSAHPDNIRKQLITPVSGMPSFASLSEQEIADLLAYLATL
ncbi:MAG: cytochrome c, partial [Candidatus Aminicenantes bacterium]|nr:cytochrome c [Candidatus Aminicenantes bacterium]